MIPPIILAATFVLRWSAIRALDPPAEGSKP